MSESEYIHLRFQAFSQIEIIRADLKPTARPLIEVQSPTNFDHPPIIKPDLPVMHVGIKSDVQDNIEIEETLLQLTELLLDISKLGLIVIASDQRDLPQRG